MLRILSWSANIGCDKVHTSEFDGFATHECSDVVPVADVTVLPPVKRKRSPSLDSHTDTTLTFSPSNDAPCSVKLNSLQEDTMGSMQMTSSSAPSVNVAQQNKQNSGRKVSSGSRLDMMRQVISSQLSLEILLKHKELRLIEQEMAKCQIALEQLRRCTEIPFPSMQKPSHLVSEGRGPAVRKLGERYPPSSPAPWGVVDGPYARHYAQWLLPDRRFDGGEPEPDYSAATPTSQTPISGRSTRGHYVDVLGGKSIKARARHSNSLQALPAGYSQLKEKATGPMILKRKSDGAMVKLVCPDCHRHDFGSAQGFINHCRIGHSRSFASHDAAAEACGEAVEYNENGTIKGIEVVASSTPQAVNVHPLVRSAKLLPQTPTIAANLKGGYFPSTDKPAETNSCTATPDFQASLQTPHLSALVRHQGFNLDLHGLVSDAKTQLDQSEPDGEEDDMQMDSPLPLAGGRHPQVAGSKQPAKSSAGHLSSNLLTSSIRPQPKVRRIDSITSHPSTSIFSPEPFTALLPSPTNESTQAPSLVDDDEEYDPQSPMSSGEMDEADVDFDVHDDEQNDRVSRFRDMSNTQPTCSPNPSAVVQTTPIRAGREAQDKQASHSAASPSPEGSGRKRRRLS